MGQPDFDAFDRQILSLLQANNRITAQGLAEKVGLSSSACQKRLKRLRKSGVVTAEVAVLAPEMLGLSVTVVVQVLVSPDGVEELDRFKTTMSDAQEVMLCYYVTCEHNFTLILVLTDTAAYEEFTRRHFIENPDVASYKSSVVLSRVKTGTQIRIEPVC